MGGTSYCPAATQVGILELGVKLFSGSNQIFYLPGAAIYNVVPPPGVPGRFASQVTEGFINFDATVRSDGDYGIVSEVRNSAQTIPLQGARVTIWAFRRPCQRRAQVLPGAPGPRLRSHRKTEPPGHHPQQLRRRSAHRQR